ncbi:MAG: NUDIX hydrolase [Oscillospiraceae bacterium]|nr:NUDIX hydrolase [Oscillospiraceae bacterium]
MDNYSLSVGVIVIRDSKVLLVKHNYGSANGKYLNPGGYLKDGELPEEAAIREVFEETGVKISPVGMIAVRCRSNEWYMVLKADYIDGEPRTNRSENDDAVFMDISEALAHPCVTDTAKSLIRSALKNISIPAADCRKSRIIYSVDNAI